MGSKDKKMIYGDDPGKMTKIVNVPDYKANDFCISGGACLSSVSAGGEPLWVGRRLQTRDRI